MSRWGQYLCEGRAQADIASTSGMWTSEVGWATSSAEQTVVQHRVRHGRQQYKCLKDRCQRPMSSESKLSSCFLQIPVAVSFCHLAVHDRMDVTKSYG